MKIDSTELCVKLNESKKGVDYYYIVEGTEWIPSDIGIINYLIKENIDPEKIKRFEHQGCNWLICEDIAMLYDNEHVRYGKWSLEELTNICVDFDEILDIKGGRFIPNKVKYTDAPSLKNVVSLEGERISCGYYKKNFISLQELLKLNTI